MEKRKCVSLSPSLAISALPALSMGQDVGAEQGEDTPEECRDPGLFIPRGLSASLSPSSPVVCHTPANAHTLCMGSWVLRALLVLSLAGLLSRSSTSVPARAHLGLQRQHVASPGDPWGLPAPTPRLSMLGASGLGLAGCS